MDTIFTIGKGRNKCYNGKDPFFQVGIGISERLDMDVREVGMITRFRLIIRLLDFPFRHVMHVSWLDFTLPCELSSSF